MGSEASWVHKQLVLSVSATGLVFFCCPGSETIYFVEFRTVFVVFRNYFLVRFAGVVEVVMVAGVGVGYLT